MNASAEHGVGIHTNTATRGGTALTLKEALVFRLRDGRITEAWEHHEDTQAWDDFFC